MRKIQKEHQCPFFCSSKRLTLIPKGLRVSFKKIASESMKDLKRPLNNEENL